MKKTKKAPEKPKKVKRIKKRYVTLALIVIVSLIVLTKLWSESTVIFLDVSSDSMDITLKKLKEDYREKAGVIPMLVGTIKAESDFEGNILVNVTNAMAILLKDNENEDFIMAANELDSSLELLFTELEIPPLKPGQVLVKIVYSGICHSQLNEARGHKGEDKYLPHCLGHEAGGIVEQISADVDSVTLGGLGKPLQLNLRIILFYFLYLQSGAHHHSLRYGHDPKAWAEARQNLPHSYKTVLRDRRI